MKKGGSALGQRPMLEPKGRCHEPGGFCQGHHRVKWCRSGSPHHTHPDPYMYTTSPTLGTPRLVYMLRVLQMEQNPKYFRRTAWAGFEVLFT